MSNRMPDELTNLLPQERQRALLRSYVLRLGVVALVLVTMLLCIAALLLAPTYVYLAKSSAAKETQLAAIEATLSSADEKELSAQLTALSNDATILVALGRAPSASGALRAALALPRPGVTLSGFSYLPAAPKKPSTLTLSGIAATRDALRSYQLALSGAAFAKTADVPVSAYAKDSDIAFTITVTLAL